MVEVKFPNKKYNIIYADPPWSFYNDSDSYPEKTTRVGIRKPPYCVLGSETIKRLPVRNIIEDNSILFIWTTDYHLNKCIEVINAWGFTYKTIGFAWQKLTKEGQPVSFSGTYTLKSGIELCLLATRGKNAHKLVCAHNVRSLIQSPRREHSRKPDEVRDRIVALCGNLPRIELFARDKIAGWDAWGNEVTSE